MPPNQSTEHGVWRQIKEALLDLLFPPRCAGCRHPGGWLCPECREGIERVTGRLCLCCGLPVGRSDRLCAVCRLTPPSIDGIRSAAYFEGVLREAIHRYKYHGTRALARPLGRLMADAWSANGVAGDVLIPVPLHSTRMRERGFNQATLLARELGSAVGLPIDTASLVRVRATAPQINLDALSRWKNVEGAFRCLNEGAAGRRVVLIDDLCTTGATLSACSIALRAAGASSVWAYTLARPR